MPSRRRRQRLSCTYTCKVLSPDVAFAPSELSLLYLRGVTNLLLFEHELSIAKHEIRAIKKTWLVPSRRRQQKLSCTYTCKVLSPDVAFAPSELSLLYLFVHCNSGTHIGFRNYINTIHKAFHNCKTHSRAFHFWF